MMGCLMIGFFENGKSFSFDVLPESSGVVSSLDMSNSEILKHFDALASFYKKNVNNPERRDIVLPVMRIYDGEYFRRTGLHILVMRDCPLLESVLKAWW